MKKIDPGSWSKGAKQRDGKIIARKEDNGENAVGIIPRGQFPSALTWGYCRHAGCFIAVVVRVRLRSDTRSYFLHQHRETEVPRLVYSFMELWRIFTFQASFHFNEVGVPSGKHFADV